MIPSLSPIGLDVRHPLILAREAPTIPRRVPPTTVDKYPSCSRRSTVAIHTSISREGHSAQTAIGAATVDLKRRLSTPVLTTVDYRRERLRRSAERSWRGCTLRTIILAGGLGTRLAEETAIKPKPMVEIGGHPIIWHIMSIYAARGFSDFTVACGYKGEVIKDYFASFELRNSDISVDLSTGSIDFERRHRVDWNVSCIDTGADTLTGGRLKALKDHIGTNRFMVTYGDGLADVDIRALVDFHDRHGRLATVTAVRPPARFGAIEVSEDGKVIAFEEKTQSREGWINGGFFVFEPEVLDFIPTLDTALERAPLSELARAGQLSAYRHSGFWQPMDTIRERNDLEHLWQDGSAPWKTWPE